MDYLKAMRCDVKEPKVAAAAGHAVEGTPESGVEPGVVDMMFKLLVQLHSLGFGAFSAFIAFLRRSIAWRIEISMSYVARKLVRRSQIYTV